MAVAVATDDEGKQAHSEFTRQVAKFLFCFVGLQCSYLTWGYMQVSVAAVSTTEHAVTPLVGPVSDNHHLILLYVHRN